MDTSDSENDESQPDGAKKRILKLIDRFKSITGSGSPRKLEQQHEEHSAKHINDEVYEFNHQKRGFAIFIINSTFKTQPKRPFADLDCKKMMDLFALLDFEIKLIENKSSVDLWKSLKEINSQIQKDCDCLACVISTHGAEIPVESKDSTSRLRQHILFTNDGVIPTDRILQLFNDDHCPNLEGKPRMFFIQACRSIWGSHEESEVDGGFDIVLEHTKMGKESIPVKLKKRKRNLRGRDSSKPDTHGRPDDEPLDHSDFKTVDPVYFCLIPCFEDFLVMFSSSSEKIAWSDCGKGGWLTYCLYEVFKELLNTDYSISLLQILTDVCGKMSRDMETKTPSKAVYDKSKSAATIYHMLTKDIFLKPVVYQAILKPGPVIETSV